MWSRGSGAFVLLLLFSTVAIVAGGLLWWRPERGWSLTMVNQFMQVIGVQVPTFSYAVVHLMALSITGRYFARETFAESEFGWSLIFSVGDSECNVGAGLGGAQTCSVTLNLLALGLLIFCFCRKTKARTRAA
jgi:hypothetical protein